MVLIPLAIATASVVHEKMNEKKPYVKLFGKVSVIMPTLNEGELIGMSLDSLMNQSAIKNNKGMIEVIVVDGGSDDSTVDIVKGYDDVVIYSIGEKGILNARVYGIENTDGDIIVSVNGDTYYPVDWLNNILYHYKCPKIVGVTTPRLFMNNPVVNSFSAFVRPLERYMYGSNSSFRRDAYYASGGFNINIDQMNVNELQPEEEVFFRDRLALMGKIKFEWSPVYTSYRRFKCMTRGDEDFCEELTEGVRFK